MEYKEFEKLVEEGIGSIPERFLKKLDNVDIVIEEKENSHRGYSVLGLYEGIPQTQRSHYGQVLPDKITIFKEPIERIAQNDPERIKEIVKRTVWHEIAHHFGMDEKRVRDAERKRLSKKNLSL